MKQLNRMLALVDSPSMAVEAQEKGNNLELEEKSYNHGGYLSPQFAFADYLGGLGHGDLQAYEAIRLFEKCDPFFDSVTRRATAFSSIPLRVWDKENEEYIPEHPVLELLSKPNPVEAESDFLHAFSAYLDITGETYLNISVGFNGEPLEIFITPPQDVSVSASNNIGSKGYAGCFTVSNSDGSTKFLLSSEELDGTFRYQTKDSDQQIWQVKNFNPRSGRMNLRGMSKAQPLFLQIQQYVEANTNNWSQLKRGGRPSAAWIWDHDQPMTDPQYQRWKEQVKAYEGALNAGRQVILDRMKLQTISSSNSDMQFSENLKTVKNEIYSTYGIPLALVNAEQMTMDNLKVSTQLFYQNAVMPHADDLLEQLTRFLMPMYDGSENLVITYNENDIPAMRQRLLEETKTIKDLGVETDNELRTRIGDEALDGGNVVYKPSMSLPAGQDRFTSNNLTQPDSSSRTNPRKAYITEMRKHVDMEGKQIWSDEEIEQMAKDYGL